MSSPKDVQKFLKFSTILALIFCLTETLDIITSSLPVSVAVCIYNGNGDWLVVLIDNGQLYR